MSVRFIISLLLTYMFLSTSVFPEIFYHGQDGDRVKAQDITEVCSQKESIKAIEISFENLAQLFSSGNCLLSDFENLEELVLEDVSGLRDFLDHLSKSPMSKKCNRLKILDCDLAPQRVLWKGRLRSEPKFNDFVFDHIFVSFPGLEELVVENSATQKVFLTIRGFVSSADSIKKVSLEGIDFRHTDCRRILELMPNLVGFKISRPASLKFEDFFVQGEEHKLKELHLENVIWADIEYEEETFNKSLQEFLQRFPVLEHLKIFYLEIGRAELNRTKISFEMLKKAIETMKVEPRRTIYLYESPRKPPVAVYSEVVIEPSPEPTKAILPEKKLDESPRGIPAGRSDGLLGLIQRLGRFIGFDKAFDFIARWWRLKAPEDKKPVAPAA